MRTRVVLLQQNRQTVQKLHVPQPIATMASISKEQAVNQEWNISRKIIDEDLSENRTASTTISLHKSQPGSGSHLQSYRLEDSDEQEYEYVDEEYFEEERIPISGD